MEKNDLRLTTTRQEILAVLSSRPDEHFYINELVRLTGRFPNSVEQAIKLLAGKKLILGKKVGNRKFYQINPTMVQEVEAKLPKSQKFDWVKLLNREVSYAFNPVLCQSNIENLYKVYGVKISTFWANGITFGVYYLQNELAKMAEKISQDLNNDARFAQRDVFLCRRSCQSLIAFSKAAFEKKFKTMDNHDLAEQLIEFGNVYQDVFPFLVTPHVVERYFEQKIKDGVANGKILSVLLSPVTTQDEEREDALQLATYVQKRGFDSSFEELLTGHQQKFCWLSMWSLNAKPLSREYFYQEIENILKKIPDPGKELRRIKKEEVARKELFEKTLKRIKGGRSFEDHVRMLQEYIFLRTYRKNALCQSHYYHLPLLDEVAKRLCLTSKDVKLLAYGELVSGLVGKNTIKQLHGLVRARQAGWAILMWQGKVMTITGTRRILETIEQFGIMASAQLSTKVIKGNPACRGKVFGKVKIVHNLSELKKIQSGDILVTKMTTPDYMVAINRCAGIITDEGGVTCHAAIVSREFNIPCVVATHVATKTLKDNDIVELNANDGLVRIIEKTVVDSNTSEIKGKPVYPGKVHGRAVIVLDANDFSKVRDGDILITSQPTPDFLSSLYRVKGLVVDEDSLTSHGVLYANSLRIPALMATGSAREIISDGEEVELDANTGVLKRMAF